MKQHKKALHRMASCGAYSRRHKGCTALSYVVNILLNPTRRRDLYDRIYKHCALFAQSMSEETGKTITPEEIMQELHFKKR